MSSCAASCCICSPKASSASAISAFSPTGDAPPSCRYASKRWTPYNHRRQNQKHPRPLKPAPFGAARSVVGPCASSSDLPLPNSNSVLHPFSPEPPHETTIPRSRTRCPAALAGVVRSSCPQTNRLFPTAAQSPPPPPPPTPPQLHPNQRCRRSFPLH